MVIISFATPELHRWCCEYAAAEAALGSLDAPALIAMLADIEATANGSEFIDLYCPDASVTDDDILRVDFGSDFRAIFVPVGSRFERDDTGRVKWQTVSRLKLISIERRN